ncbi:ATP-binding cassette domain-containing protein [Thermobifida halotolerans]|uniref:ATP-binding cassette domain-containing protein n=1 Tax=Thermobifida halotolerans TaxID=483545 RepID=A0AA97M4X7_9ACTN|nr:ATP-binding cassette domain-containing protein [Thermobifida halotolerans]UOE20573.1 ATP-binding cassette domain-containing protein [Thermobifida halotolerans]
MIRVRGLTKRYGDTLAVDHLTFDVNPGVVTGFLGPNGAGKSTTMRMILGLDTPTSGTATVNGRRYRDLSAPLHEVGALLDPGAAHPGRTAHAHLLWLARGAGLPRRRVEEVLDLVGLSSVAGRRVGGFSLGMRQRLGIAAALLGDPGVLLFDEPVNGLDPEGILWVRGLLGDLAAEGRTVLVSSHLMNEMQATADHVLVIGRGRLIADMGVAELTARGGSGGVRVASADPAALTAALAEEGASVRSGDGDALLVGGLDAARVGEIALHRRIALRELTPQRTSLEAAFMELTAGSVEHRSGSAPTPEGRPS